MNYIGSPIIALNIGFAGGFRIHGTVRLESQPAPDRAVYLLTAANLKVQRSTVTDQNGAYAFDSIPAGEYLVIGRDLQTRFYPDIVRVVAEPMP